MLRVGNKLICKKDYAPQILNYIKGKEYEVLNIQYDYSYGCNLYKIGEIGNFDLGYVYDDQISTFFYTNSEIRMKKLENLGCTSLIITEVKC